MCVAVRGVLREGLEGGRKGWASVPGGWVCVAVRGVLREGLRVGKCAWCGWVCVAVC